MAIRVENNGALSFGIMAAEVTVTHLRFTKGAVEETIALNAAVVCPAENRLRIPDDGFDIVYPAGSLSNAHMDALVKSYWDGEEFTIDAMTDDSTIVADTGYNQVTNSAWTFTAENDPA